MIVATFTLLKNSWRDHPALMSKDADGDVGDVRPGEQPPRRLGQPEADLAENIDNRIVCDIEGGEGDSTSNPEDLCTSPSSGRPPRHLRRTFHDLAALCLKKFEPLVEACQATRNGFEGDAPGLHVARMKAIPEDPHWRHESHPSSARASGIRRLLPKEESVEKRHAHEITSAPSLARFERRAVRCDPQCERFGQMMATSHSQFGAAIRNVPDYARKCIAIRNYDRRDLHRGSTHSAHSFFNHRHIEDHRFDDLDFTVVLLRGYVKSSSIHDNNKRETS